MTVQVKAIAVGGPIDGREVILRSSDSRFLIPMQRADGLFDEFRYALIRTPGGMYILVPESDKVH